MKYLKSFILTLLYCVVVIFFFKGLVYALPFINPIWGAIIICVALFIGLWGAVHDATN